jgi:very-short-patch-repair endonuclease
VDGAGDALEETTPPDRTPPQRILPYVEDRRNILILRPHPALGELSVASLTTLQYALKRGIESVYQLEESELMAEPLPTRDNRRSILFYEAAEGGAGVLTRLATEPDALADVAAEALEIMHYARPPSGQPWAKSALSEVLDDEGQSICEAGCYKCLLSYYNQPDHAIIDRRDQAAEGLVLDLLCRLTQSRGHLGAQGRAPGQHSAELARTAGSSLEQAWLAYIEQHGHRKPDRGQFLIASAQTRADFFYDDYQLAVFLDGPHHETEDRLAKDQTTTRNLEEQGYLVVRFSRTITDWPKVFSTYADLFGPAKEQ